MWKTALHLWHIVSPKQGNDEPLLHFFDTFFYERMRSVLAVTPRCWDLGSHLRILHTIPPNFSITHSAPATWIYFPSTSVSLSLFKKNFFFNLFCGHSVMHSSHCGSAGKESVCNAGDLGSIPGLGRSPGEGKGYPLQYSGLENSMDCIVHGVAKIWTQLSDFHLHFTVKHVGSVSQPGIEPVLYAVQAQDFNHWITGKSFPISS